MDFIDELKQFSKRVDALKDKLPTEEATKQSIIVPFFQLLGYDVFNPDEFMPEFTADVGIKKGEKVDYAILQDGEPIILIEAKWVKEDLKKHDSQLFRYFGTSKAKFAILTNGVIYRFFTDLDEPNKMDSKPFLEINILDIKESQVKELKKFAKASFSVEDIFDTASQLRYTNEFRAIFAAEMQEPSDNFVKLLLHDVYSGQKTTSVIEKFRPIVKEAFNQMVTEMLNDKLKTALGVSSMSELVQAESIPTPIQAQPVGKEASQEEEPEKRERVIFTTEEELEAYFIIKNMLKDKIGLDRVTYKDNERYMSITIDGKTTKWIARLYFNGKQKFITIPDDSKKETRYDIDNVYEILKYQSEIESAAIKYQ